jgi:chitin synthase
MLVCAVLCAVQAVMNIDSPIYARMIVSLASTYGIFIASSVLAMDPWLVSCEPANYRHLLTCFAQYILFSPSEYLLV